MAKKQDLDFFGIADDDLLSSMKSSLEDIGGAGMAPSKRDLELLKSRAGVIKEILTYKLVDHHSHTFRVVDNEEMERLVDSIKDYGIIMPLIVRELDNGKYEILSGHRRHFAAKKLGLKTVTCMVVDVDDDMSDIIMADSNIARETILPSEKAKTYKVRLDAAVRQGKKTVDELKNISEDAPDSVRQIQRYVKLADLSPALMDMVDEGKIPVTAGVFLADLTPKHQAVVEEAIDTCKRCPSLKEAESLKTAAARGLTVETAVSILKGEKKTRKAAKPKKEVLKEEMFWDAVPDEIKELPLDQRVEHYKKAIKAYKP